MTFMMAGGGTGGHVLPALAVARELAGRGHQALFIGTRTGMEARLVPAAGFPIEWIEIGGLKRVSGARMLRSLAQLPVSTLGCVRLMGRRRPRALFSMGGFVAGPPTIAAWLRGVPVVLMEPNAMPGFTARRSGWMVSRALVAFEETLRWFPKGKAEVTGLPVRQEFFDLPAKVRGEGITVLITGGSRGSRTLNNAARASWPLFREAGFAVRFIHQTGSGDHEAVAREFKESGLEGEVVPFIDNMPQAFAGTDLVVCRSGAGAVAELAAAGKPAILVPFPFAADDHQKKNAEAAARAGAARMVLDGEFDGRRFFEEVRAMAGELGRMEAMGAAARRLGKPGAAKRAADLMEELGG
jgi:UDP-N-acetylglucosamine--N-acetylmuramyl-(pentapeptide) pyrophosphoryl-undecaprenol N-acetylglucosamine transferase